VAPAAARGGPSSKTRREVQQAIREILGDYEHAIEDSPYGFDVDLRGVAFGLARTLVEDLIASPGVRDAKLAGGTGECRITIKLEGAAYDPEDSFADDEEETEYFKRPTAADVRSPVDDEASKPPSRKKGRAPDPPAEEEKSDPGEAEDGPGEDDGDAVEALLAEGRELVGQGEVQAAIDVLEKAVKLDRSHASAVSTLGQAYARAGDWERARRAFKHLVTLQPEDTDAQIFLAAAAMDCDRLDDAREALVTALKLAPDNARAYRYAAKLYEKTGDAERAKKFRAKYEQLKNR
jgi:tetratricopeptide (TPR) repeat protein